MCSVSVIANSGSNNVLFHRMPDSAAMPVRIMLISAQYHLQHGSWYIPWTFIWVCMRSLPEFQQVSYANSTTM